MNGRTGLSSPWSYEGYTVPIHYAYTGGPIGDRLLVKHTGTAQAFKHAAAELAPETIVQILAPGEPLAIASLQSV